MYRLSRDYNSNEQGTFQPIESHLDLVHFSLGVEPAETARAENGHVDPKAIFLTWSDF